MDQKLIYVRTAAGEAFLANRDHLGSRSNALLRVTSGDKSVAQICEVFADAGERLYQLMLEGLVTPKAALEKPVCDYSGLQAQMAGVALAVLGEQASVTYKILNKCEEGSCTPGEAISKICRLVRLTIDDKAEDTLRQRLETLYEQVEA